MKIDIAVLKDFLESTGCGLYFIREPFNIAGRTAQVNTIEDSTLIKWVNEYNERNGFNSIDSLFTGDE